MSDILAQSDTPESSALYEVLTLALEIADNNAPGVLEANCCHEELGDDWWYDLGSLSEEELTEFSGEVRYCELRGLIKRHPEHPNLFQTLEP